MKGGCKDREELRMNLVIIIFFDAKRYERVTPRCLPAVWSLGWAGFVNIEFHNVCSVARLCGICSHSHGEQ